MRADNSHHIVTAARRRATATRRRAVAALRRMDMRDKRFPSTRWRAKGGSLGPGSITSPTCAPRSNNCAPGGIQRPAGNAFLTGNAHPTRRCSGGLRSWPNEIASWKPRIGKYARLSRSSSASSALPRSSDAPATRRERNPNQSSDPADTGLEALAQVNAADSTGAEDNGCHQPVLTVRSVRGAVNSVCLQSTAVMRRLARRSRESWPPRQSGRHPRLPDRYRRHGHGWSSR